MGHLLNIRTQLLKDFKPLFHRGHHLGTDVGVRGEEIMPGHSDGETLLCLPAGPENNRAPARCCWRGL